MTGAEINVKGLVQGVGFRYQTLQKAREMNLKGLVENQDDGSVKIIAEGEKKAILFFADWLKTGISGAKVDDIKINWYPFKGEYNDFSIN
ncbi:acylphosphatase [Candidatus Parcubacteria bacterium]|nr:MAG: acylphosphatase [Candidatus Parcubacteria bacterium]